jgi:hypothetical protein
MTVQVCFEDFLKCGGILKAIVFLQEIMLRISAKKLTSFHSLTCDSTLCCAGKTKSSIKIAWTHKYGHKLQFYFTKTPSIFIDCRNFCHNNKLIKMRIRILIMKFTEMNVHISNQTGHTARILINEIFSWKTWDSSLRVPNFMTLTLISLIDICHWTSGWRHTIKPEHIRNKVTDNKRFCIPPVND